VAVAARDRSARIDEHERHRLADDIGSTNYSDFFSSDRDIVVLKERHNTPGSTTPQTIMIKKHIPNLRPRKSINILLGINTLRNTKSIDMIRKWRLDNDPMSVLLERKCPHHILELLLGYTPIKLMNHTAHTDFFRSTPFAADIREACGIVSDQDDGKGRRCILSA